MQQNEAPAMDDVQLLPLPPQPAKDPSPFFFKIIITVILIVSAASIINPETRKALSNISSSIYFKGQVWRLFTPCFVTFSAIDSLFVIFCSYVSIATFEKRVGSIVFILDFTLISLLMNLICSLLVLIGNFFLDPMPQQFQMKHTSGFFGMYFFYLSRFYYLNPDNDVPFFCFTIKQKNFPQLLFLLLMAVTSFNVPLIISVSYLMVVTEEHFFKGRFFKFNFYFYLKCEKVFKWLYDRDDFYSIVECADSHSFFNNLEDLRRLYMEEERLVLEEIREFMVRINRRGEEEGNQGQQNPVEGVEEPQPEPHPQPQIQPQPEHDAQEEHPNPYKTNTNSSLFQTQSIHQLKLQRNPNDYEV